MTAGQGFDLHPLAAQDITDIWEYIADDSPQAARRLVRRAKLLILLPFEGRNVAREADPHEEPCEGLREMLPIRRE